MKFKNYIMRTFRITYRMEVYIDAETEEQAQGIFNNCNINEEFNPEYVEQVSIDDWGEVPTHKVPTIRVYGIERDDIPDDFDYTNCSDDEFIEQAEVSGLIWEDLSELNKQIANGEINLDIVEFRIVKL